MLLVDQRRLRRGESKQCNAGDRGGRPSVRDSARRRRKPERAANAGDKPASEQEGEERQQDGERGERAQGSKERQ